MKTNPAIGSTYPVTLLKGPNGEDLRLIEGSRNLIFSPDYKQLHFDLHLSLIHI